MNIFFAIDTSKTKNQSSDSLEGSNWLVTENTILGPCIALSYDQLDRQLRDCNLLRDTALLCKAEVKDEDVVEVMRAGLCEQTYDFDAKIISCIAVG